MPQSKSGSRSPAKSSPGRAKRAKHERRVSAARLDGHVTSSPVWDEKLDLPPLEPDLFINRELSWLEFNLRVLEEAAEPSTPLLERVKFAAIFAANLDEFFMIRVAGVKRKVTAGLSTIGPDGRTPTQQLAAIRHRTQELLAQHAALLRRELLPELAAHDLSIVPYSELDDGARARVARRFEREIFPVLTPQAIDRGRRFPHVSNGSLNLIVSLHLPVGHRFARVKVPATLPRLVATEATTAAAGEESTVNQFTWLEEVVAAHLDRLFPGAEILGCFPFHVTRDSDIDVDEEEDEEEDNQTNLMMTMRESISRRAFGPVVRLMVDQSMPADVREWLADHLHASDRDLYVIDGPLAVEDLFELMTTDRPELKDPALIPAPVPALIGPAVEATGVPGPPASDVFAIVRQGDVIIHHPYQTFDTVADFVRAASTDPDVVAIKQTLYRIGKDSPLIPALIEARDDDTQVAVLVELKARFDEENNISWAEELERHGVHVAYGLTGLKTHCKAMLVVRREPDGLRRYVHLATGNYNAGTARVYEDIGMLTANDEIGSDVSELFNVLTGFSQEERFGKLWIAPAHLRQRFLAAIKREIEAHGRSGNGKIIFKANALVDRTIIRALYAASRAGVQIDLIIRGPCCLRPGVPGWSETVRVRSIVGRFLEHSRIFYFRNRGSDEVYLGSADLMERNLDRRVEVVFPVEDPTLATHIRDVLLPAYLRDTVNARQLMPDGRYQPVEPEPGEEPFDVQAWLLDHHRKAGERAVRGLA